MVEISLPPQLLSGVSEQCFQLVIDHLLKFMVGMKNKRQQPLMTDIQLSL